MSRFSKAVQKNKKDVGRTAKKAANVAVATGAGFLTGGPAGAVAGGGLEAYKQSKGRAKPLTLGRLGTSSLYGGGAGAIGGGLAGAAGYGGYGGASGNLMSSLLAGGGSTGGVTAGVGGVQTAGGVTQAGMSLAKKIGLGLQFAPILSGLLQEREQGTIDDNAIEDYINQLQASQGENQTATEDLIGREIAQRNSLIQSQSPLFAQQATTEQNAYNDLISKTMAQGQAEQGAYGNLAQQQQELYGNLAQQQQGLYGDLAQQQQGLYGNQARTEQGQFNAMLEALRQQRATTQGNIQGQYAGEEAALPGRFQALQQQLAPLYQQQAATEAQGYGDLRQQLLSERAKEQQAIDQAGRASQAAAFEDIRPQIEGRLNQLGLLNSGALPAQLTKEFARLDRERQNQLLGFQEQTSNAATLGLLPQQLASQQQLQRAGLENQVGLQTGGMEALNQLAGRRVGALAGYEQQTGDVLGGLLPQQLNAQTQIGRAGLENQIGLQGAGLQNTIGLGQTAARGQIGLQTAGLGARTEMQRRALELGGQSLASQAQLQRGGLENRLGLEQGGLESESNLRRQLLGQRFGTQQDIAQNRLAGGLARGTRRGSLIGAVGQGLANVGQALYRPMQWI